MTQEQLCPGIEESLSALHQELKGLAYQSGFLEAMQIALDSSAIPGVHCSLLAWKHHVAAPDDAG